VSVENIVTRNRQHKADGIAAFLFEHEIGVDLALLQTSEEWMAVAMLAGYREGPSDITRALIIERLIQLEQQTPSTIQ
jgi:hypothetical protein